MEGGNKMKTRLGGERSFRRFALITLGIMTILSLLPVILIVIASFTDENSLIANGYSYFPAKWSLDAYFYMVKQVKLITRAYGISFFVTITGTLLSVLFIFLIFLNINCFNLIQNIHSEIFHRTILKNRILIQQKLEKNTDIIGIGN